MMAANDPARSALDEIAVDGLDLLEEDDAAHFEVDGLIESPDLVVLVGQEKVANKTMLVTDLGIARVLGAAWLGRQVTQHAGRILFISAETGRRQMARRVKALCKGRGIDAREVLSRFLFIFEPVSLVPREDRTRASSKADLAARMSAARTYDKERRGQLVNAVPAIARREASALGRNLEALAAIEDEPEGSISLVIIDTFRACLEGDENSSNDTRRAMQAARELARLLGCPIVIVHHTNKSGSGADARSSRGSVEITAAPDVILSVDASGEHPTMHPTLRNHEAPSPFGFRLVADGDALRFEVVEAASLGDGKRARTRGLDPEEVLAVLVRDGGALTLDNVRRKLAESRGGAPGSKHNGPATTRALADLIAHGRASKAPIQTSKGTFEGYRAGSDATPDVARRVNHDPDDVFGVGAAGDV